MKFKKELLYEPLSINYKEVTFCLLDIDDFSQFNLANGFEKGNNTLKELEALLKTINPEIFFCLGSDEYFFYWTKPFTSTKAFLIQLMQAIEKKLGVTISIGATENVQSRTPEQIIKQLKLNVQIAKANGKNKIYVQ